MSHPDSSDPSRFKRRSIRKLQRHADRSKPTNVTAGPSSCDVFYVGKSSYGPVGIAASMDVDSSASLDVGDALHALVLGVIEQKLQYVENWFQCVFDIEPGLKQSEVNSELFTIRDKNGSGASLSLFLPVQYWHLIPAVPAKGMSSEWEIIWSKYKGTVCLSKLSMQREEVDSITKGSLILIPESFNEQWPSSINVPDLSVQLPGNYAASAGSWSSTGGFESMPNEAVIPMDVVANEDADQPHEVLAALEIKGVITHLIEVPSNALVPSAGEQTLQTPKTTTHQECRLAVGNGKVFTGYVAPVASGFGMFVTGGSSL